jgi:hypothetical protein
MGNRRLRGDAMLRPRPAAIMIATLVASNPARTLFAVPTDTRCPFRPAARERDHGPRVATPLWGGAEVFIKRVLRNLALGWGGQRCQEGLEKSCAGVGVKTGGAARQGARAERPLRCVPRRTLISFRTAPMGAGGAIGPP